MTRQLETADCAGELTPSKYGKVNQQSSYETLSQNATKSAKRNEVNDNMVEIIVDASELKDEGKEVIQGLADFMKEKTGAEVTNESNKVTVKGEGAAVSKKYLRVLVRKFLHKQELKDYFRVISGDEDTLKVKEKKLEEE